MAILSRHNKLILLLPVVQLLACSDGGNGNGNAPGPGGPPPLPASVQVEQVFGGVTLSSTTALTQEPGGRGRWFALQQAGVITVFDNDPIGALGTPFLDITARVQSGGERGLLGIAFHPDFANNGEVFVSYTSRGALTSVISRFRSFNSNQTLDPTSEEPILTVLQEQNNHNGGDIHFGPDGYLYISLGDGGGGGDPNGNGQNTTTLLGSLLRIDVDVASGYAIPGGNPFAANAASLCLQGSGAIDCPEIYAWGFRNPWRFSFDRQSGELWVGDVGQGAWEEVDRVSVGENHGWNTREGAHCYPAGSQCSSTGLVDPITEYDHSVGVSITGGYVYRGADIAGLQGHYVFGDFGSGRLWSVPANSPVGTAATEIADTTLSIAAFAEDSNGELYVVDFGGSIHQIVN